MSTYYSITQVENLARQHNSYRRMYILQLGEDGHVYLRKMYREGNTGWKVDPTPLARTIEVDGIPLATFNADDLRFN